MSVSAIKAKLEGSLSFDVLAERIASDTNRIKVCGLAGSLGGFVLSSIKSTTQFPLVAVTVGEEEAEELRDDLETILGQERVRYFPPCDVLPYEEKSPSRDVTGLRVEALDSLIEKEDVAVVTTMEALLGWTIPSYIFGLAVQSLKVRSEVDLEYLATVLVGIGFERVPIVEGIGQLSIRGGILDVYSFGAENPTRIEFFGDQIESIREFDLYSQRSLLQKDEVRVLPRREVILLEGLTEDYSKNIESLEEKEGLSLDQLSDQIRSGILDDGVEGYMPVIYKERAGILDYLEEDWLVFLQDPDELDDQADRFSARIDRALESRKREEGRSLPKDLFAPDVESLHRKLSDLVVVENLTFDPAADGKIDFAASHMRRYEGDLRSLREDTEKLSQEGYLIEILCDNKGQAERLEEVLEDVGHLISMRIGNLHRGFVASQAKIALLNDHEIFGHYKRRHRYHKFKEGTPISNYTALQRGDFVVHVDYGIGQYQKAERLCVDHVQKDFLLILYRDRDKLYVPIDQLDRVQNYSVEESVPPALSKLGGSAWEKMKQKTKRAIYMMAKDLVELQALRRVKTGFAFPENSLWQKELEASFMYQETPDQLLAVEHVKADLEKNVPTDRLVCGDVGYGKTEVAMRAAFKVVCDHKQVAVLVPTTILAQQHHRTFTERLENFPLKVEVLSRFKTKKEQKRIVEGVRNGQVDIVIGTHRLLSKDMQFKDLGLVIIDEEHRFGVKSKEELKRFRRMVDVLSLTATPIPRTLHMSLMGVRDLSVINTPPKGRMPIYSEIVPFDEERIAEAILREIHRNGQVYFVHNRVQSIDSIVVFLRELLPQVRFAVAHGQMPERELEKTMVEFLDKKYDCLVSTMIIESGLDIPNVNTIIINRADRFGLAQLYQLKGRVGRSNQKAYAYLVVPPKRTLNIDAKRRLRAIQEFQDLGSGFNIAMRDLEIRGGGNILGPQQHGFIAAVGFDLYCRLLDEAIRELKGEEGDETPDPHVEIMASAYIPQEYIPDVDQKVIIYKRLAETTRSVEILAIEEELKDRYGNLPDPVLSLLDTIHLKILAKQLGLETITMSASRLRLVFPKERKLSPKDVELFVKHSPVPLEFSLSEQVAIDARLEGEEEREWLQCSKNILQQII